MTFEDFFLKFCFLSCSFLTPLLIFPNRYLSSPSLLFFICIFVFFCLLSLIISISRLFLLVHTFLLFSFTLSFSSLSPFVHSFHLLYLHPTSILFSFSIKLLFIFLPLLFSLALMIFLIVAFNPAALQKAFFYQSTLIIPSPTVCAKL